jgi:prepilin-type N-terminal cleavage/methylation domain-containing protein
VKRIANRESRITGKGRGFTLVELLVVVVILSLLASLMVVVVSEFLKDARVRATQSLIQDLSATLSAYRSRWGDYPPTSLEEFGVTLPNRTNGGGEALAACLGSELGGGTLWGPGREDRYTNTDGDEAPRNVTKWFWQNLRLLEIKDSWDYPLSYIHHKDYAKGPFLYVLQPGLKGKVAAGSVCVDRSGVTNAPVHPSGFQIKSVGPDGKPGTPKEPGDDVTSP